MENYHILKVSNIGPTNTRPALYKIQSERFGQTVKLGTQETTPLEWLKEKGFEIIGQGEARDQQFYYLISTTFQPLR